MRGRKMDSTKQQLSVMVCMKVYSACSMEECGQNKGVVGILPLCMWAAEGKSLLSARRWRRGLRSWVGGRAPGHLLPARPTYQLCPQTGRPAGPGSWRSSGTIETRC